MGDPRFAVQSWRQVHEQKKRQHTRVVKSVNRFMADSIAKFFDEAGVVPTTQAGLVLNVGM
jgi:hypothetical protein